MFYLIIVFFILGYVAIALEHNLSVDKAAIALVTGALIWVCVAFGCDSLYPSLPSFQAYLQTHPGASAIDFVTKHELFEHLSDISELLFYLLGSMTIVEIIDSHGGFLMLSKVIKTHNKVKLLWIFSFLTFFVSAALDNLTATILMVTLMWKLIGGKNTRWFFASMIVIAANAGGAWSPIGDITTLMLWIGGQVSAVNIILQLFVPSLIAMLVPLIIVSLNLKGETVPPSSSERNRSLVPTTDRERWIILLAGIGGSLFIPVFKHITHLPPYMGVLLVVGIMWIMTEILHRKKRKELKIRLTVTGILKNVDTPTIFFLLGLLLAVAGIQSAGHLNLVGQFLDDKIHNIYAINLFIGALSSVLDNVPLVAGMMGVYDVVSPDALAVISDPAQAVYMKHFVADGSFWELLAYCSGTGGSLLVVGSAAGVAAMGLAKVDFMWYLKKVSLLAFIGYISGIAAYFLIVG